MQKFCHTKGEECKMYDRPHVYMLLSNISRTWLWKFFLVSLHVYKIFIDIKILKKEGRSVMDLPPRYDGTVEGTIGRTKYDRTKT